MSVLGEVSAGHSLENKKAWSPNFHPNGPTPVLLLDQDWPTGASPHITKFDPPVESMKVIIKKGKHIHTLHPPKPEKLQTFSTKKSFFHPQKSQLKKNMFVTLPPCCVFRLIPRRWLRRSNTNSRPSQLGQEIRQGCRHWSSAYMKEVLVAAVTMWQCFWSQQVRQQKRMTASWRNGFLLIQ